jgi:hypothetical protein
MSQRRESTEEGERTAAVAALAAACERAARSIRTFLAVPPHEQARARLEAEKALAAVEEARERLESLERSGGR